MSALGQKFRRFAADHAAADHKSLPASRPLAIQKLLRRHEAAFSKAGNTQDERIGARGEDDRVGAERLEHRLVGLHAGPDIDARVFAAHDHGPDRFGQLSLAGGVRRDAEVAAELLIFLQQRHLMPAQRENISRVQSARAAADHDDVFRSLSRSDFGFSSDTRVHRAGDGPARKHVRHAPKKTADAGCKGLELIVSRFIRKLWVRDALPAKGDKVASPLLDQELCVLRLCEPADNDDRNGNGPLARGHEVRVEPAVRDAGRPHELIMQVHRARHMQRVHAALLF